MILLLRTTNHKFVPHFAGQIYGAERARTADPYLAKVVLSQLSYCPGKSVHSSWFIVKTKNKIIIMILLKKATFFLASSPFNCLELVIIKKS